MSFRPVDAVVAVAVVVMADRPLPLREGMTGRRVPRTVPLASPVVRAAAGVAVVVGMTAPTTTMDKATATDVRDDLIVRHRRWHSPFRTLRGRRRQTR